MADDSVSLGCGRGWRFRVRRFDDADGQKSQPMITWAVGTGWDPSTYEASLCCLMFSFRWTAERRDCFVSRVGMAPSDLLEVDEYGNLGGARWCVGTGGRRGTALELVLGRSRRLTPTVRRQSHRRSARPSTRRISGETRSPVTAALAPSGGAEFSCVQSRR